MATRDSAGSNTNGNTGLLDAKPIYREPALVDRARMKTSLEDMRSFVFWKALFAEFLGTFILVLTGLGSTVQGWQEDELDVVQIALCFGLCVATSVWIVGHVSGGHINPAVTIAMFATRRISLIKMLLFMIVQCIGSIAAAALLRAMTPVSQLGSLGCTTLAPDMTSAQGVGIELFITMFLVLTVFASCDKGRKDLGGSFPLTIGLSVTMAHLWAVEFTGSSMNPARSLGPAVVMDIWDHHWVYWVGPLIGGVVAGLLYDNVLAPNATMLKARDCLMVANFDDTNYKPRRTKVTILEDDDADDTL